MIIGITGKKGVGKDTLADYLVKEHGFVKLSFAKYLKEFLKIMFDWDDSFYDHNKKEKIDPEWGISPREMMQFFGTDVLRNQLKDKLDCKINKNNYSYHIKRLNKEIIKLNDKNIVISDVRFQDEIDYLKSKNGIIIKIIRNKNETYYSNHSSENQKLSNIDHLIENNDSVNRLYDELKNFI